MKLICDNEEYVLSKVVKGSDYIVGYNETEPIIRFDGIGNFDGYRVEDGDWSEPEPTIEERLAAAEQRNQELEDALVELACIYGGE